MAEVAKLNDNEKVIEQKKVTDFNFLKIAEQTLSDDSHVYAILIGNVRIDCMNFDTAVTLYDELSKTKYSIDVY